jgi:putative membrane-bound dehydrogenase-like protein
MKEDVSRFAGQHPERPGCGDTTRHEWKASGGRMISRKRVLALIFLPAGLSVLALTARMAEAQGFAPEVAARRMSVAEGLEVRLVAAEPMVRQPVAMEFDDRGRLWVIQYLQYPNPAGLKRVVVDRYSRTVYDRIPEPPPRGPKGTDRITILEDADGDGLADGAHDFVSDLSLASGLAFGREGVFVLQAPYLLFYPDRDRDDRPDSDPEVLLAGFGIEDAHSVANSLTWGPDGWLYGLQGSTVTARVRGVQFQQGVWRYHPRTQRFELFCEGGGNMWGLDFDRRGQLFASTNVGGFVMLHGVQGGYYWKSFGKHGPLHNPYTFGYFDHVRHDNISGGHVAVGGLFYEADALPPAWRGRYIAADLLDHSIHAHELARLGSTFRARQVGDVLRANDTWFAPTDLTLGPDGALYVSDWHDRRTAHPDPDADWDRTNGRIFTITAPGAKPVAKGDRDLSARTDDQLVALLDHPNTWYRRKARRLLADRHAAGMSDRLRRTALEGRGGAALEALWAWYGCAGFDASAFERLLGHSDTDVRAWSVRLVGDELRVPAQLVARLVEMAGTEPDVAVRAQLACTARRLAPERGLDVAYRLLVRDQDANDPHLPLLLWWAVEQHAIAGREHALTLFTAPDAWQSSMIRQTIQGRLVRRYALEASPAGDQACARVLASAPLAAQRQPLLAVMDEAMRGRGAGTVAPELARTIMDWTDRDPRDVILTRLSARLGSQPAVEQVRAVAADRRSPEPDRLAMLDLLGELKDRADLGLLLDLSTRDDSVSSPVRSAALGALGRFEDESIASALLAAYSRHDDAWRSRVRELLLSRASWARAYLAAVDRGALPAKEMTLDQLGRFPALQAPDLAAMVRKHWGATRGATREERLAEVRRLNNDLRAAPGDPTRGHRLFLDRCASCHRLHGEGETIGPDLTFANRRDRDFLLVSLVDPSGVVRKEYQAVNVATNDGRIVSGLIVEQTPQAIVLRDAKGQRTQVPVIEVEEVKESEVSLMPESLYKELSPEQLRDLFSFIQQ